MAIDYKHLLEQYMRLVVSCEGITFLDSTDYEHTLSDEEQTQLEEVARAIGFGD